MNYARHRLRARMIILVVSGVVLLACFGPTFANDVRAGREFKLKIGERVNVRRTRLQISFSAVENDSRCPSDVTCVWAGNAAVHLQLGAGRGRKTVTLNTSNGPSFGSETVYQGYKIKLVGLSPYPRSDRKIQQRDYTATLLVSKE
jgi:hypothetical protein